MTTFDPNAMPWNDGAPWSAAEKRYLREALESGDTIEEVAQFLQRTESDLRAKMHELGLAEPSAEER